MKIKKDVLLSFIEKFRMTGHSSVEEAIFKFTEDRLSVIVSDPSKLICSKGILKPSAFVDYEAIGNIGLNELHRIVTILKRFKDIIVLNVEGNLLTISEANKKVSIELVSETFIEEVEYKDLQSFKETFIIEATEINDILGDASLKTGMTLKITTQKGVIIFTNNGKYKFERTLEMENCIGETVVKVGVPFSEAVNKLTGTLEMSIATDYRIKLVETSDDQEIIIVVASMVGGDD